MSIHVVHRLHQYLRRRAELGVLEGVRDEGINVNCCIVIIHVVVDEASAACGRRRTMGHGEAGH